MSDQKWTKEPWEITKKYIPGDHYCHIVSKELPGLTVAYISEQHGPCFEGSPVGPSTTLDPIRSEANAARIVQCVNACAGMDDPGEEFKRLKLKIKAQDYPYSRLTLLAANEFIRSQCDDLVNTCEITLNELVSWEKSREDYPGHLTTLLRNAIAAVKQ